MYPKPLYARLPEHFAVKGEVYHSTVSAHADCIVGDCWLLTEIDHDMIETCGRPKGAHPNEVRVSGKPLGDYLKSLKRPDAMWARAG
jgi:hypothetical protein